MSLLNLFNKKKEKLRDSYVGEILGTCDGVSSLNLFDSIIKSKNDQQRLSVTLSIYGIIYGIALVYLFKGQNEADIIKDNSLEFLRKIYGCSKTPVTYYSILKSEKDYIGSILGENDINLLNQVVSDNGTVLGIVFNYRTKEIWPLLLTLFENLFITKNEVLINKSHHGIACTLSRLYSSNDKKNFFQFSIACPTIGTAILESYNKNMK